MPAFEAAERHGVRLCATLFPFTSFEDVGGFKFPRSDEHHAAVLDYLRVCVTHFAQLPACAGWVLINEPGVGAMPSGEFVERRHAEYLDAHPFTGRTETGYPAMDFRSERFLLSLTSEYLREPAVEVRRIDPEAHIHLNPHGVFGSVLCEYDFPAWREFLDSFGGFPWMMTEVQGGTNTYSGATPISPTGPEIAQWLWIILGSGGRGARADFTAGQTARAPLVRLEAEQTLVVAFDTR